MAEEIRISERWRWAKSEAPTRTVYEWAVLQHLAEAANGDTLRAWPSIQTISADIHASPRTVKRALRALRERGIVEAKERPGRSSVYTLTRATQTPHLGHTDTPPRATQTPHLGHTDTLTGKGTGKHEQVKEQVNSSGRENFSQKKKAKTVGKDLAEDRPAPVEIELTPDPHTPMDAHVQAYDREQYIQRNVAFLLDLKKEGDEKHLARFLDAYKKDADQGNGETAEALRRFREELGLLTLTPALALTVNGNGHHASETHP